MERFRYSKNCLGQNQALEHLTLCLRKESTFYLLSIYSKSSFIPSKNLTEALSKVGELCRPDLIIIRIWFTSLVIHLCPLPGQQSTSLAQESIHASMAAGRKFLI
ncbi:hypothetical protein AVEN_68185-1 [Araneus ventricosus]|uniref:Uncharacterized protein n=1 Tax=Araneus ventricosus TaxID=182803 RepID=A0A4Y2UN48_ARAVE|nr:hypothetical protein AVEN_68185-1 [Araneus ventricosus]